MSYQTLPASTALPPLASVVFALAVIILKWEQRQQTRRALKRLDARLLDDVGLSQADVQSEIRKPFWWG